MVLLTRTVQESFSKDFFKKAVDTVLKGSIFSKYKIYDKDKRFAIIEIPLNSTSGEMDYKDFLRLLAKVLDEFNLSKKSLSAISPMGFYPSITSSKGFLAIKCYAEYGNFFEKKQREDAQISPSLGTPPAHLGGIISIGQGSPTPGKDAISSAMKTYLDKNSIPQRDSEGKK